MSMYRIRVASTGWAGSPGLNTFYFRDPGILEPSAGRALECATRVRAAFFSLVNTFPAGHVATVDPTVDVIAEATGDLEQSFSVAPPAPTNGIAVTGFQGIALMLLLSLRTSDVVAGRRVRGRAFIGPVAEQQDTNGTPNADQSVKLLAAAAILLAPPIDGGELVVWARPFPGQEAPLPVKPARAGTKCIVTAAAVSDKYAVLRSRRD